MARVAIGIPTFNEEIFIASTLESALKQFEHFSDLEIFISDNCSEDNTISQIENVLENSKVKKSSVKVIKNSVNHGAKSNFWRVFDSSDSEFFLWLGSHDQISENYISHGIQHMLEKPETSMFCGTHKGLTAKNELIEQDVLYNFNHDNSIERYLSSILKLSNCYIFHSIFRRKTLKGYSRPQAPSADHIIISRWLWSGKLHQSRNCVYFRRYFDTKNRDQKNAAGKYVNQKNNMQFFDAYLTDLSNLLSDAPPNIKTAIFNLASDLLFKRFGMPHLGTN